MQFQLIVFIWEFFGFSNIYHSDVLFDSSDFSHPYPLAFGPKNIATDNTGIVAAFSVPGGKLVKKLTFAVEFPDSAAFNRHAQDFIDAWNYSKTYDLLDNNCNHFVDKALRHFGHPVGLPAEYFSRGDELSLRSLMNIVTIGATLINPITGASIVIAEKLAEDAGTAIKEAAEGVCDVFTSGEKVLESGVDHIGKGLGQASKAVEGPGDLVTNGADKAGVVAAAAAKKAAADAEEAARNAAQAARKAAADAEEAARKVAEAARKAAAEAEEAARKVAEAARKATADAMEAARKAAADAANAGKGIGKWAKRLLKF